MEEFEFPLGLGPVTLRPGEKKTLRGVVSDKAVPAGEVFVGVRLVVLTAKLTCRKCGAVKPDDFIVMTAVRAAGKSLMESSMLPTSVFSEMAVGTRLRTDPLRGGQAFEVDVSNENLPRLWWQFWKRDRAVRVQGVVFGTIERAIDRAASAGVASAGATSAGAAAP